MSDFDALYLKCLGLPRGPQYQFWKVYMSTFSPRKLALWFSALFELLTLELTLFQPKLKISKNLKCLKCHNFSLDKAIYMSRCSKYCSGIADFIMLRTVFVAQTTPEILQVKLWHSSANFRHFYLALMQTFLGLNFSLLIRFIKMEVNAKKSRSYLYWLSFYHLLYINKPTVEGTVNA